MKARVLLITALCAVTPATAWPRALTSLASVRVGYTTRKNTVTPQGELKAQIDALDAQIAEAGRLGKTGELRCLFAKGITLLAGRPWTDAADFSSSLVLRTDRVVADSTQPYTVRLEAAAEIVPYRMYVPTTYTGSKSFPLIVALHGLGGTEDAFFDNYEKKLPPLAEQHGYIVAAPLGYRVDGSYGWGLGNPPTDPRTRRIAGFQRAGCDAGAAEIIVHGDADPTVNVAGSRAMVAKLKALGAEFTYIEVPGGLHSDVVASNVAAIVEFFDAHKKGAKTTSQP